MKIIGITGPSGAGKGALGEALGAHGVPVIDTDRVYHDLLLPPSACLDDLVTAFGKTILTPQGTFDRAAMAVLVFGEDAASRDRHATLNRITHRHVTGRTEQLLTAYRAEGRDVVAIDAPLLFEAEMDARCDLTVAVLASQDVRLSRLLARDKHTKEALLARMRAQPKDDFYRARADIVIENNATSTDALAIAARDILARPEILT